MKLNPVERTMWTSKGNPKANERSAYQKKKYIKKSFRAKEDNNKNKNPNKKTKKVYEEVYEEVPFTWFQHEDLKRAVKVRKEFGCKYAFEHGYMGNWRQDATDEDHCYFNRNHAELIQKKEKMVEPAIRFLEKGEITKEELDRAFKTNGFWRAIEWELHDKFIVRFRKKLIDEGVFSDYKDYYYYKDAYDRYDELEQLSKERALICWILMRPKEFRKAQMEEYKISLEKKVNKLLDDLYDEYEIVMNSLEKYYNYSKRDSLFYQRPKREVVDTGGDYSSDINDLRLEDTRDPQG